MLKDTPPRCANCKEKAEDLPEYIEASERENMSVNDYVLLYEGTFNQTNAHFLCWDCWNLLGQPEGVAP